MTIGYFVPQEEIVFNEENVKNNRELEEKKWQSDFTIISSYETKSGTAVETIVNNKTKEKFTLKGVRLKKWHNEHKNCTITTDF